MQTIKKNNKKKTETENGYDFFLPLRYCYRHLLFFFLKSGFNIGCLFHFCLKLRDQLEKKQVNFVLKFIDIRVKQKIWIEYGLQICCKVCLWFWYQVVVRISSHTSIFLKYPPIHTCLQIKFKAKKRHGAQVNNVLTGDCLQTDYWVVSIVLLIFTLYWHQTNYSIKSMPEADSAYNKVLLQVIL